MINNNNRKKVKKRLERRKWICLHWLDVYGICFDLSFFVLLHIENEGLWLSAYVIGRRGRRRKKKLEISNEMNRFRKDNGKKIEWQYE